MTSVRSCSVVLSVALLLCSGIGCSSGSGGGGPSGPEDADGVVAKQGRQVYRADHRIGSEGPGCGQAAGRLIVWVSDPEGDESYPIVTYTWIIAYKKYADATEGQRLERRARLLPDRRSEGQRVAGLHSLAEGSCRQGQGGLGEHQGRRRGEGRAAQGATPRGRRQLSRALVQQVVQGLQRRASRSRR